MACVTIIRHRSGKTAYAVDVVVPGSKRSRINLGSVPKKHANRFCDRIQSIEDAVRIGCQVDRLDEEWLRNLPPQQYERVVRSGLLDHTGIPARLMSLSEWVDIWLATVSARCSERTVELYSQSAGLFTAFLGRDIGLVSVTRDLAAQWCDALHLDGLSESSVRRHIRQLKACFNEAIGRDILMSNPFDRLASASIPAQRDRHVSEDEARAVLAELPSPAYKVLFALARFGGLRSPSETMVLEWEDLDSSLEVMRVTAQKTQKDYPLRAVPIVPDLRSAIQELAEHTGTMSGPLLTISSNNHPRTVKNAALRAGVKPWPRTFQTLRQSFSTSMAERFPEHVVAAWAGHSPEVSRRHYLTVRDEYLVDAAGRSTKRSTAGRNEAEFDETTAYSIGRSSDGKSLPDSTIENSPARIRTGDQAIMSRAL